MIIIAPRRPDMHKNRCGRRVRLPIPVTPRSLKTRSTVAAPATPRSLNAEHIMAHRRTMRIACHLPRDTNVLEKKPLCHSAGRRCASGVSQETFPARDASSRQNIPADAAPASGTGSPCWHMLINACWRRSDRIFDKCPVRNMPERYSSTSTVP